jgi:hypothetical protein
MNLARTAQTYLNSIDYRLQRAKYAFRGGKFSHSGEQQIIWRFLEDLLPPNIPRIAVDIGAGNGIRWSNSYSLFLAGWEGIGIEGDTRKFSQLERAYRDLPGVRACQSQIEPDNVIEFLKSLHVPKNFGILSLDIDGNDYWVLRNILKNYRPALVVTEINEKIPPPLRFVVKADPDFRLRHHFYGYSIAALEDLCADYDYGLLTLEYNNAFIAPREFCGKHSVSAETVYAEGYRDRPDRRVKFATNVDLEPVLTMTSEGALEFLNRFYANEEGKYYLAKDRDAFQKMIRMELENG